MKIQSLSVDVPVNGCINACKFCVSRMDVNEYKNQMDTNLPFYDLYLKDYIKRLEFARDNGCNNVILTGKGEPQQNRNFLTTFGLLMMLMEKPFRNIEMQTAGVLLDENYLRFLRNHVGVNTIALSLSALDDDVNAEINGTPEKHKVNIKNLCALIKRYDFNLRVCLNMTDYFYNWNVAGIFDECELLGADQVTFRKLYQSPKGGTPQDKWIASNSAPEYFLTTIKEYIEEKGRALEILEYGLTRYSVHGMSTVIDTDCMSSEVKETAKYLILRPDCKLYSKWQDKGSRVF